MPVNHAAPRHAAPSPSPAERPRRRWPIVLAVSIVVVVAAAYAAGAFAFSTRLYPNTVIAGTDVSLLGADEAAARIEDGLGAYRLSVEGDGFSWTYEAEGASIFDERAAVDSELASNEPAIWPARLFRALTGGSGAGNAPKENVASAQGSAPAGSAVLPQGDPLEGGFVSEGFDRGAFEDSVGQAVDAFNEGRTGELTAQTAYDAEAKSFSLEQARSNERLDRDAVTIFALAALARMDTSADLGDLGARAWVPLAQGATDDELESAIDQANALIGVDAALMLGGTEAEHLDSDDVASWIVFGEGLVPSIDQAAEDAWIAEVTGRLTTVGTERTYTRPDGKQVTVSGGTFGWDVDDQAFADAVRAAVENKQTDPIDVPTTQQGDTWRGAGQPDWNGWLECDRSEQHARLYDADGNLTWESGVITGNPRLGNETPTGVYYVRGKNRNIVLVSRNLDENGEPEYESPVDYWIPFIGSSYGFHDASWQSASSFGVPGIENRVGSHGCINTPHDKVAELYNMVEPGLCVIIHD